MNVNGWKDAREQLCKYYVEFYVNSKAYKRMEKQNSKQSNVSNISSTVSNEETNNIPRTEHLKIDLNDTDSEESTNLNESGGVTEEDQRLLDKDKGAKEFKKVIKKWMDYSKTIQWKKLYPELKRDGKLELVEDLMKIDLKKLMDTVQNVNRLNKNCFGLLPLMSSCSKCQLGALNAQSFAERINSAANLIVTKEKVSLDSSIIDKLVTLRMNRSFMAFVQSNKQKGNINLIAGLDKIIEKDEEIWS